MSVSIDRSLQPVASDRKSQDPDGTPARLFNPTSFRNIRILRNAIPETTMATSISRILLVDDEPQVLDGLRRMLMRASRRHWAIEMATSGPQALACMRSDKYDAVISDMRMPGMDGADLLTQVGIEHPETIRIILTGEQTESALLRSLGPTHQLLSKPCDSRMLAEALKRSFQLRDMLSDVRLRALTSRLNRLPSLPALYTQLVDELESPDGSAHSVGALVARDIGMSAKIVQLVNSAYFGSPRSISDPVRAVIALGVNTVRSLVLAFHVFEQLSEARQGVPLDRLFHYGLLAARAAQLVATKVGLSRAEIDQAYLAGLLHDVGLLVLGASLPAEMKEVIADAEKRGAAVATIEHRRFGASHSEVGAYLLGLWGLPSPVVEAVAFHHRPDDIAATEASCSWATRWAELALVRALPNEVPGFLRSEAVLTAADEAVIPPDRFDEWVDAIRRFVPEG